MGKKWRKLWSCLQKWRRGGENIGWRALQLNLMCWGEKELSSEEGLTRNGIAPSTTRLILGFRRSRVNPGSVSSGDLYTPWTPFRLRGCRAMMVMEKATLPKTQRDLRLPMNVAWTWIVVIRCDEERMNIEVDVMLFMRCIISERWCVWCINEWFYKWVLCVQFKSLLSI